MTELEAPPLIQVHVPARATFERWLARGDSIGVFTNSVLDSSGRGRQLFMPLTPDEAIATNLQRLHAPDGAHGTGWKYLLTEYVRDLARFEFVEA